MALGFYFFLSFTLSLCLSLPFPIHLSIDLSLFFLVKPFVENRYRKYRCANHEISSNYVKCVFTWTLSGIPEIHLPLRNSKVEQKFTSYMIRLSPRITSFCQLHQSRCTLEAIWNQFPCRLQSIIISFSTAHAKKHKIAAIMRVRSSMYKD